MSHSKLAKAALDGDAELVKKLIESGSPLDGSDGEKYDDDTEGCIRGAPYYLPLGEAARMNHPEVVRVLLAAGTPINALEYRGETALILAATWDALEPVKILLEAGADVHRVGCLGNALGMLQPGWKDNALAIAELLLKAGCSPTATESFTDCAIDKWLREVPGDRDKVNQKHAQGLLAMFRLVTGYAGDRKPDVLAAITKLEKKLGAAIMGTARTSAKHAKLGAGTKSSTWAKDVRAMLGPLPKKGGSVHAACTDVLSTPSAIAHPAWPALIREVLALSLTYGDVTEMMFGERLGLDALEDDESGSMDFYGDDHLYTFDWVLELLAKPAAIAHASWADLVIEVCARKKAAVSYYSFGDEEIAALLAVPEVQAHARFAQLVGAGREAFPFAQCFGSGGALTDTKGTKVDLAAVLAAAPKPKAPAAAKSKRPASKGGKKAAPKKAAPKKAAPKKAKPKKRR